MFNIFHEWIKGNSVINLIYFAGVLQLPSGLLQYNFYVVFQLSIGMLIIILQIPIG